jgi:four helix bundle protein
MGEKIKTFTDLNAWKEARKLVLLVYKITNKFPTKEDFALTSQMRRAVVSVSSNIAEGFSRRGHKEKILFYSMSLGSVTELQNQLLIAKDVGYLGHSETRIVDEQLITVHKLVNGLIKGVAKLHNT